MTNFVRSSIVLFFVLARIGFASDLNHALHLPLTFSVKGRDEKLLCEKKKYDKSNGLLEIFNANRRRVFDELKGKITNRTINNYVKNAIVDEDEWRFFKIFEYMKTDSNIDLSEEDYRKYLTAYTENNDYDLSWVENFIEQDYRPNNTRVFRLINALAYLRRTNLYIYRQDEIPGLLALRHRFVIDEFKKSIKILAHNDGSYSKLTTMNGNTANNDPQVTWELLKELFCNNNFPVDDKRNAVFVNNFHHENNILTSIPDSINELQNDFASSMPTYKRNEDADDAFNKCDCLINEGYEERDVSKFQTALTILETVAPDYNEKSYYRLLARIYLARGNHSQANGSKKQAEWEFVEALKFAKIANDKTLIAKSNLGIGSNCTDDPTNYLNEVINLSNELSNPLLKIEAYLAFGYDRRFPLKSRRKYAKDAECEAENLLNEIASTNFWQSRIAPATKYRKKAVAMLGHIDEIIQREKRKRSSSDNGNGSQRKFFAGDTKRGLI